MRYLIVIVMVFLVTSCATLLGAHPFCKGAPKDYMIEPIRGTVVDQETQRPIEGAIVVAFWKMPLQVVKVMESVTDATGTFSFPGWGPIKRNKEGCFLEDDPLVKVFKPGYFTLGVPNTYYGEPGRGGSPEELMMNKVSSRIRKARHDGATLKLEPFVLGQEIEYTDANGRMARRNLTEEDWCYQVDRVLNEFVTIQIEYSLPGLKAVMQEGSKAHPRCFNAGELNLLDR